ncbi:hypothetical protein [Luteolibacter sp. AS25]|uniref:hypothetical protein n=1 Tax=Luteolibacter sp. AS25 TaxID=3135776 RepID=UPI00398B411A
MKMLSLSALSLATLYSLTTAAYAAVYVDFSGGGGTALSITLPELQWEITNAAGVNLASIFGIGIAVG